MIPTGLGLLQWAGDQPQSSRDLETLLQQSERDRQPLCLVILTVADLHQINRQFSHAAGNQVLELPDS